MEFVYDGVGINDSIVGSAPVGYTARNAEASKNVRITGTGFTPDERYTLAVEMNVSPKNSVGDRINGHILIGDLVKAT